MEAQNIQAAIAAGLKRLRKERRRTQVEVAALLGLSQAQLSKVESGRASLSAEQLVQLLRHFSLPLNYFVEADKSMKSEDDAQLQNALVHLGATHLRTVPNVAVPERLVAPEAVILEVLLAPSARFVTALSPVIVQQCESLNFHRIAAKLQTHGIEYRIWWVVDGIYQAVHERLKTPYLSRRIDRLYQRAYLLLGRKKLDVATVQEQLGDREDELDRDLISKKTIKLVKQSRDKLAKHWHIVTRIKKADFEQALKDTEET